MENLSLLAQQGNSTLNDFIDNISDVLYLHNLNPALKRILSKAYQPMPGEYAADMDAIDLITTGFLHSNRNIVAITYVSSNRSVYSSANPGNSDLGAGAADWSDEESLSGLPVIGTPFYGTVNGAQSILLPISKQLIDIHTGRPIGRVIVYANFKEVCRRIESNTNVSDGFYTLILKGEELIYSTNTNRPIQLNEGALRIQELAQVLGIPGESGVLQYEDGSLCAYGVYHPLSGWTMIKFTAVPMSAKGILLSISAFLMASILCFSLLLVAGNKYSQRISRDIYRLHDTMCSTSSNRLVGLDEAGISNDEIGDLTRAFNRMVRELNESIQKEYITKLSEKDMQIRMLNYQINPHFLYNCLNLISAMARVNGVGEICDVSKILGDMFHYSIEGSDFVTIEREIRHTQDYLRIQAIRFGEVFSVDYRVDPPLHRASCIKFILQPLVENCFKHGFAAGGGRAGEIGISITRHGGDVCVEVVDNGTGIPPPRLEEIHTILYEESEPTCVENSHHIGLWNVNKRLQNVWGPSYGIEVESRVGEFTLVRLLFPFHCEVEDEDMDCR